MNSLPSKQELLAFQDRWLRPAGILAIVGSLLFAAGVVVQQTGLDSTDTDFEQLQQFHDNSSQLILGQAIQGFGFSLFAFPIYVLFKSAAGRSERVRRSLLPLALIGPPLFFIGAVVASLGLKDAADQFVEERPAIEQQARQAFESARGLPPNETEKESGTDARGGTAATTTAEATRTGETTVTSGTTTTTITIEPTEEETVETFLDDEAEDIASDSSGVQIGSGLRLTATLALVFALIYTPLWAMRTGLLTRFWATLGMALGVSLLLVGLFGLMGLVIWFAAIGLQLAGWWPGPRPPAWAAGEAIPWPRPGEDVGPPPSRPSGGGDAVEGSGREVSETPLPEPGSAERPSGETQGQRRKKRKRRE